MAAMESSQYVTYNNKRIGALQAKYLVEALNLESGATKTIEFFHGSQEDNNSRYYYKGAMEVLQPYINNGTLLVRSGEIKPDDISVDSWHKDSALKRMEHIIAQCLKNNQYVKYNDAVTYHNGIRALDSLVIEPASVVDRYNVSSFMMVRQLFGNQFASLKF